MNGKAKKRRNRLLGLSLGITILIAWLAYAAVFVHRIYRGGGEALSPELERLVGQDTQEEWFSIYQHGRKAGYSHTQLLPEKEGHVLIEEIFLRLDFLDEVQDIFSIIHGELAQDFSLKSFTFSLQAGPIPFRLEGHIQDSSLKLVTWMAGDKRSLQLPLSSPIYLGGAIKSFLSHQHLEVGDTYQVGLFDPTTMSQTPVSLRVVAEETIKIHEQDRETLRVELDFHGVKFRSWITAYGEVLKEEGFLGMTLIKTHEEDALEGLVEVGAVRLMKEVAIVPGQTIDEPRGLKRLELQLTGIKGSGWSLAGGRQAWAWRKGRLTVRRETLEELPSVRIPQNDPVMAQYLQSTLLIQSDAPELTGQAAAIVGEEKDALTAVRRITEWVHDNVEKRPTLSIPSALDVWSRRTGDCNEHSVIFAALARAAGIPTRVVAGLLYVDGRFFYHAWNEVHVGQWVAVDALMNQVPADPTHIRLVIGGLERQVQLVRVIGKLEIRVLDYE